MFDDLKEWLTTQFAMKGSSVELESTLLGLINMWPLPNLLQELLADQDYLTVISRRSYQHDNGFDRIELFSNDNPEYGLRLHLWPGNLQQQKERVHGHPWNFASTVIAGQMHIEQFIETNFGDPVDVYEYERPLVPGQYDLKFVGQSRIQRILTASIPAGTRYSAHYKLLHRVWAEPGCDTVTLMLHGAGIAYPSKVFGTRVVGRTEKHAQPQFGLRVLTARLQHILSLTATHNKCS